MGFQTEGLISKGNYDQNRKDVSKQAIAAHVDPASFSLNTGN